MTDKMIDTRVKFPAAQSRFCLHGPTYKEMEAEEAEIRSITKQILDDIRQREVSKKASKAIRQDGEMLDDGTPEEDVAPNSLLEPDSEDRADFDAEEHAEDPIDPHYYYKDDGSVWPWWHLDQGSISVQSRGHVHEVRPEINKYFQIDSDPEGFYYFRDGVHMRKFFPHLVDALVFIEHEIQAQIKFETRIWCSVRVKGMAADQQRYVLDHAFYSDRLALCKEFLSTL